MRSSIRSALALAPWPVLFLVVMLIVPVGRLGLEALAQSQETGWQSFGQMLQDAYLRWRLGWTVLQAIITCCAVSMLGIPIAWVLARFEFAGRSALLRWVMMPFVIPTLVAALGVMALLGPRGLTQTWWGWSFEDSPVLLLYGNVFFNLGLVIRASVQGLERVSANQLAVAKTLGASQWRVFWRVQWPVMLPSLLPGLCLVFLFCFGGFGLALILGGHRYATLEVEIYTLVAHELRLGAASQLALISLALTACVALLYLRFEIKHAGVLPNDSVARQKPATAYQRMACVIASAAVVVICVSPLLALCLRLGMAGSQAWAVLWEQETMDALLNSLKFSAMGTALAVLLGLLHALASVRFKALHLAGYLSLLVSPVAMAFGLLLAFPNWVASQGVLVGAYALLAFPLVTRSISASLAALPPNWLAVAATLGASPWRSFWRITIPAIKPSLRNAMALASATCLGEFAVTLFLSRPQWATITTLIHERLARPGILNLEQALVLAAMLLLLAWLAFALLEASPEDRRLENRRNAGGASHA